MKPLPPSRIKVILAAVSGLLVALAILFVVLRHLAATIPWSAMG